MTTDERALRPLADEYVTVWIVEDPEGQIAYCPTMAVLPTGRLVGCLLIHDRRPGETAWVNKILTSDDKGQTWTHRKDLLMTDAFPFVAGDAVYAIGGKEDLKIARSDDWGDTWTDAIPLQTGKMWYSFPGPMVEANGRIHMVKECRTDPIPDGFPVWILAPVVCSAKPTDDLTRPESWSFSNELGFQELFKRYGEPNLIGVPFYEPGVHETGKGRRHMPKLGWGEANLVQITDPDHIWYDPNGRTFHIIMRCNTGRSNIAALAKAVEQEDGSVVVDLERAPSGKPVLYIPLPGANIGFIITKDPQTNLHWLVSNQITDSMRRLDRLDPKHYGMPANERRQLALYFSRNCMDWCFAGLVATADEMGTSHYHGATVIDGDDLLLMMRTSDADATNEHNSNLITFHRLPDFRGLAY